MNKTNIKEQITRYAEGVEAQNIHSLAPLLSLLQFEGKPVDLRFHFQLAPIYNLAVPKRIVLKTARQVGKSFSICMDGALRGMAVPNFHTLYIQPRFDQIKGFSNLMMRPFIHNSYVKAHIVDKSCEDSILIRTFKNGSRLHFSYCLLDADRVRGLSGISRVALDESLSKGTVVFILKNVKKNKVEKKVGFFSEQDLYYINIGGVVSEISESSSQTYLVCTKQIQDIKKGDKVISFDRNNKLVPSLVAKDASAHGVRECFTLTTVTGKQVTCTIDHPLMTNKGAMRLSDIVTYMYSLDTVIENQTEETIHKIVRVLKKENRDKLEDKIAKLLLQEKRRPLELVVNNNELDYIEKIRYTGAKETFDIEVVGTHTYLLANGMYSLNCQDIDSSFIPVIGETMSASRKYGIYQYTGTPKTTDNTLSEIFNDSSMAEWVIPCKNCLKLNVPSIDHDILNMIGLKTLICANKKCGKPLDARDGWYEHGNPHLRNTFAGYHVPQIIHPLHYTNENKWADLLYKQRTYTKAKFLNEVLGEPCDEATKLITVGDIQQSQNQYKNTIEDALKNRDYYETVVLGVDWGGGGALENSFTALAIVGVCPGSDKLDTLYCERFPMTMTPIDEIRTILTYATTFRVSYIGHDYGGAGNLREVLLLQAGVDPELIVPYTYVNAVRQEVVKYNKPGTGQRASYSIDKPRSLAIVVNMIKAGKITLPQFDRSYDITKDLLALQEEVREMPRASDVYLIVKAPKKTDDFAHALNYACSTIWHIKDCYPSLMDSHKYTIDADTQNMVNPANVNWD